MVELFHYYFQNFHIRDFKNLKNFQISVNANFRILGYKIQNSETTISDFEKTNP